MNEDRQPLEAFVRREPVASIMFVLAIGLTVAFIVAAMAARKGHWDVLEAVLIATMVFSVAGVALGLMRNLRSRKRSPAA